MRITITKRGLRTDEVYFITEYGEGKGIWCGNGITIGEEYQVELELARLLMRWVDVLPAASSEYSVSLEKDQVVFTGRLDNIEEDGTAFLRLGDGLVMFECLGEPMPLGAFVEVRAGGEVRIFPLVK